MAHGIRATKEVNGIPVHAAANMFPMMDEDEFETLRADIEENGLKEPIEVDEQGNITDGRNRWKALAKLGTKWNDIKNDRKFVTTTHKDDRKITEDVWSANFARRHLTAEQKGAVILNHQETVSTFEKYEAEAKAQAASDRAAGKPASKRGPTARRLAKEAGISEASAEKVIDKRKRGGPQAMKDIVENVGRERRGTGPREKARMPSDPIELADYIIEKYPTGQVRKIIRHLTDAVGGVRAGNGSPATQRS